MIGKRALLLPTAVLLVGAAPPADQITADGSAFRVTRDGKMLRPPDRLGTTLNWERRGASIRLRIDGLYRDPDDTIWLHDLKVEQRDGSWRALCAPDADGRSLGFPVAGRVDASGAMRRADDGAFEIFCTSGAQGKCVLRGYRPWSRSPDGEPMLRVFNACVRMLRADYGGTGKAVTRDGTRIDIYDKWDEAASPSDTGYPFEAGWDEHGAVCVHHLRIAEGPGLAAIEAAVPRLRGRTGSACSHDSARKAGALIFSGSKENAPGAPASEREAWWSGRQGQ